MAGKKDAETVEAEAAAGFDPSKHTIKVQGGRDYLPVKHRMTWFREEHPDWGIDTAPLLFDMEKGIAVFRAQVFNADGRLMATGTKTETARGFADFIEKAETGAIGRALGVLGYGVTDLDDGVSGNGGSHDEAPRHQNGGANRPASGGGPGACAECGAALTQAQVAFSTNRFGKPLCPAHQSKGDATERTRDAVQGTLAGTDTQDNTGAIRR